MKKKSLVFFAGIVFITLMLFPSAAFANENPDQVILVKGATQYASYPETPTVGSAIYGYLEITSNPSNANIYINGVSGYGTTPQTLMFEPGTYLVEVKKQGYSTYSQYVHVDNTYRSSVYAPLAPQYTYGYLSVSSSPSGADVYIDNVYVGITPINRNLESGVYNIIVKKAGYRPYSTSISVRDGSTSYVSAPLQTDTASGYINVITNPAGAGVYVDNSFVGNTPLPGGAITLGPYGTNTAHSVTVSASGYQSQTQQAIAIAGQTQTLNFNLAKDTASTTATVTVSSSPGGAYIYLDNVYVGVTPVTLPNIETGSHVLKLSANGYSDYTETISVKAGDNLQKSIAMSVAPAPTAPPKTPMPLVGILAGLLGATAVVALRRH